MHINLLFLLPWLDAESRYYQWGHCCILGLFRESPVWGTFYVKYEGHQCLGIFFICHTLCILSIRHQDFSPKCLRDICDAHKSHIGKDLPLLHCRLTHAHTYMCPHSCCTSTHPLSFSPRSGLFSSMRSTRKPFLSLTLLITYSFWTGDRCTTQAVSQQEKKVIETEWVLVSCGVYWPFLTLPNAYLGWEERSPWLLFCLSLKSCFVEDKPIIGSGTNSCFHHRLKGRKLPNKKRQQGWREGTSPTS